MSPLQISTVTLFALLHGSALATPVVSGAGITGGDDGDCALLATEVTLQLSNKVKGAYVCGTNAIGLSTCHPGGRRILTLNDGSASDTGVIFQALTGGKMGQVEGCPQGDTPIPDTAVRSDTP